MSFQTTPSGSAEVRPSAAVAVAFLTQAFIWMFAVNLFLFLLRLMGGRR